MFSRKQNKGITLVETAVFASLAVLIGLFTVKVSLYYKQRAAMQRVADKFEAKFDGAFVSVDDYYTQLGLLMDESVTSLNDEGLDIGEGFNPVMYKTPLAGQSP